MKAFLAPYQRITSGRGFIPEVDGLRFVAIAGVFIYHLAGDVLKHTPGTPHLDPVFNVTQYLNVGVPLFFVISGFILGLPFATARRAQKDPPPPAKYYGRRVTRLEPPYLLSLVLLYAAKVLVGHSTASGLFPHLLASVFYVHNPIFGKPSDINFVAWSLEIEVQFYVLAPLLALVFAWEWARGRRLAIGALIVSATAVSVFMPQSPIWRLSILGNFQYFLAGFLMVEWYLASEGRRDRSTGWDAIAAIAGVGIVAAFYQPPDSAAAWTLPWLMSAFFMSAFLGRATNRVLTHIVITTIGGMCYSIYLLHNYAISAVGNVTERVAQASPLLLRLVVQSLLITPPVLAICATYFRFVERPCMRPDWFPRLAASARTRWIRTRTEPGPSRPLP